MSTCDIADLIAASNYNFGDLVPLILRYALTPMLLRKFYSCAWFLKMFARAGHLYTRLHSDTVCLSGGKIIWIYRVEAHSNYMKIERVMLRWYESLDMYNSCHVVGNLSRHSDKHSDVYTIKSEYQEYMPATTLYQHLYGIRDPNVRGDDLVDGLQKRINKVDAGRNHQCPVLVDIFNGLKSYINHRPDFYINYTFLYYSVNSNNDTDITIGTSDAAITAVLPTIPSGSNSLLEHALTLPAFGGGILYRAREVGNLNRLLM